MEMDRHNHEADRLTPKGSRPMKIALTIVVAVMVFEIIGGILSNSLALLGDAGHMFVDALALGLSLFAMNIARRPATASRTYGYHRAEIMAALINGTILIIIREEEQAIIKAADLIMATGINTLTT